jgi:pyrimidine operon attenuation protein/uracil phosphoribosyltransferase
MSKEILDSNDINRAIRRMAHEIIEKNKGTENLCLVGIQKGGVVLAGDSLLKSNPSRSDPLRSERSILLFIEMTLIPKKSSR